MVFGFNSTPIVESEKVENLIETGSILIDVREDDEWIAGHHSKAVHIAMGTISDKLDFFDKKNNYIVVCRSGARSAKVTKFLINEGFDASNLDGGMKSFSQISDKIVNSEGQKGQII